MPYPIRRKVNKNEFVLNVLFHSKKKEEKKEKRKGEEKIIANLQSKLNILMQLFGEISFNGHD